VRVRVAAYRAAPDNNKALRSGFESQAPDSVQEKAIVTTTESSIIVTDDLIVKYRSRFNLNARVWQDHIVRGYVLALSTRLTIASMMSWTQAETDIAATLARFEPLEEIREHSYAGSVLWIAFNAHCAQDMETTRTAIETALKLWTNDVRLLRMRDTVCSSKKRAS
jgi:hypothetical protein